MRRRRLWYYRRRNGNTIRSVCVIIAFVALIRLVSGLAVATALDDALARLGSNGSFVYGTLRAQTGRMFTSPDSYDESPASTCETAEDIAENLVEEETPTEEPTVEEMTADDVVDHIVTPAKAEETPLTFTQQDADGIAYTNATAYTPDTYALLTEPLNIDFSAEGPLILIVHTHTCEAYTQEYPGQYDPSDSWRTTDQEYNIVAVGDELQRVLTDAGIGVIHDRTVNDYPTYTGAYTRTLEVIQGYLSEYPSIQIVIDLHRDSGVSDSGEAVATYYDAGGETASQVMLVVGTDEGGLPHENWRENLKLALELQATANSEYPGLMRPVNLRQERFNQHLTCGSLIVETGFAGNTLAQAKAAIRLFGQSICRVVQGQMTSQ